MLLKRNWPKLCPKVVYIFVPLNLKISFLNAFEILGDASTVIGLQGALKFNGGGHINHSIFWQNLCSTKDCGEPNFEVEVANVENSKILCLDDADKLLSQDFKANGFQKVIFLLIL